MPIQCLKPKPNPIVFFQFFTSSALPMSPPALHCLPVYICKGARGSIKGTTPAAMLV